jgi:purine-binding chemotaxis protein CheW
VTEPEPKLVCFALGEQVFGLPIDAVQEAVALRPITPVFLVPSFVRGIMNLRGEVVAVLDLLRLLGLEAPRITEHSRVVVVRQEHGRREVRVAGLLADSLCGVMDLPEKAIQPCPATLPPSVAGYVRGVVSRDEGPILVLDLEHLLAAEPLAPYRAKPAPAGR